LTFWTSVTAGLPDLSPQNSIKVSVRFGPLTIENDWAGPISYAKRAVGGWGKSHKQAMREQFGRVPYVGGIGESLPDPNSYIDLDPEATDDYGLPRARIHSHLAEMELRRLEFMAKTSRAILEAAGDYELTSNTEMEDVCPETAGSVDGFLVDVELKCWSVGNPGGGLELDYDCDWRLKVDDDSDVVCNLEGTVDDYTYSKVEAKCTNAETGPPQGNANHSGGNRDSVEAQIKIADYSSTCEDA
jgi:hypothetical protein